MQQSRWQDYLSWALAIFIAFVFIQSLFFKFSNSFETQHIFSTIGAWMSAIGFPALIAESFAIRGGYVIGSIELVAAILLLVPRTQATGAFIALCVISGAIFFHLFTPLGISVVINEAGDRDGGQLFAMAVGVLVSSTVVILLRLNANKTVKQQQLHNAL